MSKVEAVLGRVATGRVGIKVRVVLRRHPRARELAERVLLRSRTTAYEQNFHAAMMAALRPGDVVWDVGANVGLYTSLFADAVGASGTVVAFEPSPGCRPALLEIKTVHPNVTALEVALTDYDGSAAFDTSRGETDVNNHVRSDGAIKVRAARADTLQITSQVPKPDIVKIDVEGFECEVLAGFGDSVTSPRAFFIEVHFGKLADRGLAAYPTRLSALLHERGFGVTWVDPSHLAALRT